jgi:biopolymer transport protein ExbD
METGACTYAPIHSAPVTDEVRAMSASRLINLQRVLLVALSFMLPAGCSSGEPSDVDKPEAIVLHVGSDGSLAWNGTPVSFAQADAYLAAAAAKEPQPEIHLSPDRRARYVDVARVLEAGQRHRVRRMGFASTGSSNDD